MKTEIVLTALIAAIVLPSCTAVVPAPAPTTTQQTTTSTQVDPYTGDAVYKKTTTTSAY